ncbi:hypothetical protein CEY16_12900 [Halalkalibacillus sediminis]|uniref:Cytochrome c oxidase subunit 4 n=1 Tax=Halalkalibacillus sediminis TaxID=2018042 RepID=A0A2I0QQV9_9BACI|nr:hypothetical protein [Halalkalibacillus sediminis]PKR76711.1 hypothetical protein CEY16_12900 [Halalkalibacillus sediminis]
MIVLLNVGSLLLGLVAWLLPIVNLLTHEKHNHKRWVTLSIMSFSACAIALCFQIFYSYHLVKIEDWSALMDITGSVAFAATVLLVVTILLNVMTLFVYRSDTAK